MDVQYRCCCGIDVHKETVTANLLRRGVNDKADLNEVRSFSTMTRGLLELCKWLERAGCTHVAMESTGVYRKPIFNILESDFEVILVNANHIKNVPGRKTDVKDCQWIAQLLQHGLLQASFIPPLEIRQLRDLTRERKKLIQDRTSVEQVLFTLRGSISMARNGSQATGAALTLRPSLMGLPPTQSSFMVAPSIRRASTTAMVSGRHAIGPARQKQIYPEPARTHLLARFSF
jgi:transposase